jgi:hypothetical protein
MFRAKHPDFAASMDNLYGAPERFPELYPTTGKGSLSRHLVPTCDRSTLPAVRHGAFVDDLDSHSGLNNTCKATPVIAGESPKSSLRGWLVSGTDALCMDFSSGFDTTSGTAASWAACP